MRRHIQHASDGILSDSLIGEQVGKSTTCSQQHHGYPDARTGRPTDRQREINRRPDRCGYCRSAQVERLIAQLSGAHGQLPHSIHVEPRRTDALLSAHKQRVLLPSPPACSSLSGSQTGGDVRSLGHCHLLFFVRS